MIEVMKKRIVLSLAYEGTLYRGWQKQKGFSDSIEDAVQQAVSAIACHPVTIVASGRTDKGVHALRQIVHFDSDAIREMHAWVYGVNRFLPSGIQVQHAQEVDRNFHARFKAQRRFYRYLLSVAKHKPLFLRHKVGWVFYPLNLSSMQEATPFLLGKQDFSSFRASDCQASSAIKTLYHAAVYEDRGLFCFDFAGDGFLHHMVRNIIGALVEVGRGRLSPVEFKDLIEEKSRRRAPPTFSAEGLYFLGARYDPVFGLNWPPLAKTFWGNNAFLSAD